MIAIGNVVIRRFFVAISHVTVSLLLEVAAAGTITGGIKRASGVIAGHEPCGGVAAVGSAVSKKEARIDQRVMDHHYKGCGTCKHCRTGWTQMCLDGAIVFGSGGHGAHAK